MVRFRFRFTSRVSLEIDDLRFSAGVTIAGSTTERPVRDDVDHGPDLAAELATYSSPSDLAALHAMLDRHDDVDTDEIRAVLQGQARQRLTRSHLRSHLG